MNDNTFRLVDCPAKSEIAENNRCRISGDCKIIRLVATVNGDLRSVDYCVDHERMELRYIGISE